VVTCCFFASLTDSSISSAYQERIIKVSDEVANWHNEKLLSKGNLRNNSIIEQVLDDEELYEKLLAVPEISENKEMNRVYLYSMNITSDTKDPYLNCALNKADTRTHSFSPVKHNKRTSSTKMPLTRKYKQSIVGAIKSKM